MSMDEPAVARLVAAGVVHGLGFDPRAFSLENFRDALPTGDHAILRWQLPEAIRENADAIDDYPSEALEAAADLIGSDSDRVRLELRDLPDGQEPEWLMRTIGSAERPSLGSAYLHEEGHVQPLLWQWPLRVGFFDDGASRQLYEDLTVDQTGGGWREQTIRFIPPTAVPGNCSLIVVPALEAARARLDEVAARVRCGALLFLGWDGEPPAPVAYARQLLRTTWAAGVLFSDMEGPYTSRFLFETFRGLTHNYTIDRALVDARSDFGRAYPLMIGSTALMRDSRLSRVVGRWRRSLDSPEPRAVEPHLDDNDTVPKDDEVPRQDSGSSGDYDPGDKEGFSIGEDDPPSPPDDGPDGDDIVNTSHSGPGVKGSPAKPEAKPNAWRASASAHVAEFEVEEWTFDSEGDYSLQMADLGETVEEGLRASGIDPDPGCPRFLQGQVTGEESEPLTEYFLPETRHQVRIRVGAEDPKWLQSSGAPPFPVDELPPDLGEYQLTVVLAVLGTAPARGSTRLPAHRIVLPRAGGDSTECAFVVDVPDSGRFEARVLVLFRDRILQTGRLSGPVGPGGEEAGIRFEIEALACRYFSGLDDGTRFQHALLFNQDPDGGAGMTAASAGEVRISAPRGLSAQLDKMNNLVSSFAYEPETFEGTLEDNPTLLKYIIALARDGSHLRQVIEQHIPSGSGFDARKPIQILTKSQGDKIPIEFFYDHAAPKTDAELCPGTPGFFEHSTCDRDHDRTVFCPSGFWGLNRVIERHAFTPLSTAEAFVLRNEPTAARRALSIGNQALFAGTRVVDDALGQAAGLARVKSRLDTLTDQRCRQVSTWTDWTATVGSDAPGLLVLLVHTDVSEAPFNEQQLEIGDDRWLLFNDICAEVVSAGSEPGPVVFLIGCKTGAAKIRYKSLANKFKLGGAALIVSSDATIHSAHAVPVLESLIANLSAKIEQTSTPFGEVMRTMRREMLATGNPIVLCLTAYGDADWVLT